MRVVQTALPVSRSSAVSFPPQSGKYTFSRSTAGVAETSPAVWKTHFTARCETFSGEMVCSAALARVLSRFWPAEGHSARFFSWSAWAPEPSSSPAHKLDVGRMSDHSPPARASPAAYLCCLVPCNALIKNADAFSGTWLKNSVNDFILFYVF